jgi:hypothetical protein
VLELRSITGEIPSSDASLDCRGFARHLAGYRVICHRSAVVSKTNLTELIDGQHRIMPSRRLRWPIVLRAIALQQKKQIVDADEVGRHDVVEALLVRRACAGSSSVIRAAQRADNAVGYN